MSTIARPRQRNGRWRRFRCVDRETERLRYRLRGRFLDPGLLDWRHSSSAAPRAGARRHGEGGQARGAC